MTLSPTSSNRTITPPISPNSQTPKLSGIPATTATTIPFPVVVDKPLTNAEIKQARAADAARSQHIALSGNRNSPDNAYDFQKLDGSPKRSPKVKPLVIPSNKTIIDRNSKVMTGVGVAAGVVGIAILVGKIAFAGALIFGAAATGPVGWAMLGILVVTLLAKGIIVVAKYIQGKADAAAEKASSIYDEDDAISFTDDLNDDLRRDPYDPNKNDYEKYIP